MWKLSIGPYLRTARYAGAAVSLLLTAAQKAVLEAQVPRTSAASEGDRVTLDSLVKIAVAVNPKIAAAGHRVDGARARVGPAGARPDPVLLAGIQNQPIGTEGSRTTMQGVATGGRDPMTMHIVGVSQTIPYPGKVALRTTAAQRDLDVASAAFDDTRLGVVRDVRAAYYEIAYLDASLGIVDKNRAVLTDIIRVTEAHYATGSGAQQDVLRTRVEIAHLAEEANALTEQRRAQVASINALLGRASETPIDDAEIPARIARAALPDSEQHVRFASNAFGAAVADSPLPSLAALQEMAIDNSTMLREHEARIAAQNARVSLAERETKPDIDISLQYGQRSGLTDMVSAMVSVPIPIQHASKQDEDVAAARDELAAEQAEHAATVNDLRQRITKLYTDLERERTQLALDVTAVLPQGRAALSATTANYQAGTTELVVLLDSQSTLFSYETSYYRSLADFADTLAELDQVVGKEVLP